jgi:hypothetical protein
VDAFKMQDKEEKREEHKETQQTWAVGGQENYLKPYLLGAT